MSDPIQRVIDYHENTKHSFDAFAPGPDHLDWATQPDPFRRYEGAPLIHLDKVEVTEEPSYDAAFRFGAIPPTRLDRESISRLFFDSLAISAWKSAGSETWALRVDPSSGNLHPTEGYLVCGPIDRLCDRPMVCHYAPKEHAFEVRAEMPVALWDRLSEGFPEGTVFIGITSIHCREAWKYGERAYRYCQHDVGHVLGAVSIAAAGLGWRTRLLDNLSRDQLSALLGVDHPQGAEPEEPDCLLAVWPHGVESNRFGSDADAMAQCAALEWNGKPNVLSSSHVDWRLIRDVTDAARKPETEAPHKPCPPSAKLVGMEDRGISLRRIIRQRRSAQAMDGKESIPRSDFYRMVLRLLPRTDGAPFATLPWPPNVHLVLFAHRVDGLPPGMYALVREPSERARLQQAMRKEFVWKRPEGCPKVLGLYLLEQGDARRAAMMLSCTQSIAGDGCFGAAMISRFRRPLEQYGPCFYPRLYWECGMIGQVFYLEAEAARIRGTGIGCFLDDPTHEILGLQGDAYQDLYHFTVGGPVEDPRITTLPPYPGR